MRSPIPNSVPKVIGQSPQKRDEETITTASLDSQTSCATSTRKSFLPQKSSLSYFGFGNEANVRVVARICANADSSSHDTNKKNNQVCVFAVKNESLQDVKVSFLSPSKSSGSKPSPVQPSSPASHTVSGLTAMFDSPNNKPLMPLMDMSTAASATPSKLFSPSQGTTPLRANGNGKMMESCAKRQSFIPAPTPSKEIEEKIEKRVASHFNVSHRLAAGDETFHFDAVVDASSSQEDVYNLSIGDAIRRNIFRGYNTTVMSYGQRNSGKTFTMYGPREKKYNLNHRSTDTEDMSSTASVATTQSYSTVQGASEEDGIVPRAIHDLFMAKNKQTTGGEVLIHMTFVEIYNDGIVDLLTCKKTNGKVLEIRDNVGGNNNAGAATIKGLTSIKLRSFSHARHILDAACKRRVSTRSHTICTVHVTINPAVKSSVVSGKLASMTSTDVVSAKLTLVDLAGSQRSRGSTVHKDSKEQKEDASISNDLLVLAKCISALGSDQGPRDTPNKMKHVPFRDCKLTRILRDSFGGNCCTIILACVSPIEKNLDETLSFLKNAEASRNIKNRIKRNMIKTIALTPAEGAALRRENKVLKSHVLDMTRQMQMIRRGQLQKPKIVFDFGIDQDTQSDKDSFEVNEWRLKCEKLVQLCRTANISTDGVYDLSSDEESLLKSNAREIQELKEQIHHLMHCQADDGESMTSGITMEVEDFDNHSITSRTGSIATILSLSNQSLKSCEILEKDRLQEIEEMKVQGATNEKLMRHSSNPASQRQEEEKFLNEKLSTQQELLRNLTSEIEGINKTIAVQKEEQKALGEEIQHKLQEIRLNDLQLLERKKQIERLDREIESLKKQVKLLMDEKLALAEEVEDTQNMSNLIEELSAEKSAKTDAVNMLQQARDDFDKMCAEREVLQSQFDKQMNVLENETMKREKAESRISELEAKIKELEDALKQRDKQITEEQLSKSLEIRVSELESIVKKQDQETISRSLIHDSQSEVHKPPLAKKRKCSANSARDLSPRSNFSTEEDSIISVSRLLVDCDAKKQKTSHEQDASILFGDYRAGTDDFSTFSGAISSSDNTMTSDQKAIRIHAQKLLFWADKAISKNDDATASSFGADKENCPNGSFPTFSPDRRLENKKPLHMSQEQYFQGPSSVPSTIQHKKGCSCTKSIFSGKKEHTEFFLPKLGLACNCGAEKEANKHSRDPTALTAFLRSWQVAFLRSVGITSAQELITRYENQGQELARAMKHWRYSKRMKPARTKSCLIALQIWSKTAKTVLRSNRKHAIQRTKIIERATKPYFLEITVSESDDVSRMSMDEFNEYDTLLEGEYEI